MRDLWARSYTGEGFWGGGRVLGNLAPAMGNNTVPSEELQNIEVCGGIFRSRRSKRKRSELTWKEKRDSRIERKFGKNGQSLGEDENQRLRLEIGRNGPIGTKPRVAGSKRGRELRAAAALARFGPNKKEVDELDSSRIDEAGNNIEDDEGDYEEIEEPGEDVVDSTGHKILDKHGKGLIRVCGEEDGTRDEVQVKNELDELDGLNDNFMMHHRDDTISEDEYELPETVQCLPTQDEPAKVIPKLSPSTSQGQPARPALSEESATSTTNASASTTVECPICSMTNECLSPTCCACAHVLALNKMPSYWTCDSEACSGTKYVNSGDCGRCGVCGMSKTRELMAI